MKIGSMYMTAGVNNLVAENTGFAKHVTRSLARYGAHDWGDLDPCDRAANDAALKSGEDRILAAYKHPEHSEWRIWIITEWDRSATTILFPSEY